MAGRSISGWIPSLKTGTAVRQPFCSQLEERLMLWLEYHPQVKSYARGDIGTPFATTYRLPFLPLPERMDCLDGESRRKPRLWRRCKAGLSPRSCREMQEPNTVQGFHPGTGTSDNSIQNRCSLLLEAPYFLRF